MAIDVGQGGRFDPFTLAPLFPGSNAVTRLEVPDPLFPEIKGTVRFSSGPEGARTAGQTAMGARATGRFTGNGFSGGFKQVIRFKFMTALYAGIKDADGCIEDTSTGLNFRSFLDCSLRDDGQAPWAPFYLPRQVLNSGQPFTIEMPDQPAGRVRLQRRNQKRDRLNFLVSFSTASEFVTFFAVERPDGSHALVRGFTWKSSHEFEIDWDKGNPKILSSRGSTTFIEKVDSLPSGDPESAILTNPQLRKADTLVAQFNFAMTQAKNGQANSNYAINEFENYTSSITPQMRSRVENMV